MPAYGKWKNLKNYLILQNIKNKKFYKCINNYEINIAKKLF